ncbi:MAG: Gfo/Idh/MocA family oxidoreductase [Erysipelotrichaceae bacterium]|nr:Gfo/Idh/MocA family oxidoreductase [Erysipelotrichaceae bacterium]
MKLGIAGAGLIVETLMQFIDEVREVEKVAICSLPTDRERMEMFSREHDIGKIYYDFEEMLKDGEVETVYLGVPNFMHYTMGKKALEAGKNVIMEKPFCSSFAQAQHLADLAYRNDLIIVEAITNQYNPNFLKMKQLLPQIGEVKIVNLNYTQYSSRYDDFRRGIIKPAFDVTKSGGALMDLNVYNVHVCLGLLGKPKAVHYYPNIEKNIDTSGILVLEYDDFQASLVAAKDCGAPLLNCVQGNKGCLYTSSPLFTLTDFSFRLNGQPAMHYDLDGGMHRMKPEFLEFVDIIDNHDAPKAAEHLQHTLDVMEVLTLARQSAGIVFPDDENL